MSSDPVSWYKHLQENSYLKLSISKYIFERIELGFKTADLWKVSSWIEVLFNTDSALITGLKTSPLLVIIAKYGIQVSEWACCIKHCWGVYEQIS